MVTTTKKSVRDMIQDRIDSALEMTSAGFTTKAAQKRALESLSKAYELARRDIQDTLISKRVSEMEADESAQTDRFYYDIPLDLHNWREKHTAAALAISSNLDNTESITWMVTKINEMFAARNAAKDTVISAAPKAGTVIDTTNPIAAAIEPLRQISVDNAERKALAIIALAHKELEAGGYDLRTVAPRLLPFNVSKEQYDQSIAKHSLYSRLTDRKHSADDINLGFSSSIRIPSKDAETKFIEQTKEAASFEFDKYVAKMISKVGDVDSAELTHSFENNIWGYSVLTVVIAGATQHWQTQQIINTSKLGKLFNQWPTRLMK